MARKQRGEELPKVKLTKTSLSNALRIFKFLKPYRGKFLVGLMFLFLTSLTALAFPLLMGRLIDAAADTFENINTYGLILLIVFSLQAVFSFFRIVLFVNVTENMLASLRRAVYTHLITLPMSFFSQRRVGELNSRLAADITQLQDTFTTTLAEFLRQFLLIIGGIVFLSLTSGKLTLIMLAIVPLLAVLAVVFGRYIRKISRQVQDSTGESNTIVEETLQGITNVKAFTNEFFEISRYTRKTQEIVNIAIKGGKARGAFASFVIFCLFGSIVFVIWYGVKMVNAGDLTIGAMIQFVLYSVFVGASIGGIAELYAQIQRAVGATERIFEILDEAAEIIEIQAHALPSQIVKGLVEFNEVAFSYPSRKDLPVLSSVSFEAKSGETIAIVGPSGAGKSTIAALLLRFYDANKGTIAMDGNNIKNFSLTELRSQIAIVPQEVLLFGGTIKENINYGNINASMEEIMEAAKKANAHHFIERFPDAYETMVGERGIQLSGGQRQRIAIARAVLKNPAVLILDEATSSLDSESEKLVQDALEKLMEGRTSFVIAHRLSTIVSADKILVIDRGEIVESGIHEELMKIENGIYRNLSKIQMELN
ncbi:MAG: ATP-binding cassette domain-containing protein [Bacteroidetes bacterium]|nr:ATP-binding cassette domain-containing protein [Bacteroidota bacterium]